ncbi:MAG: hypothetical protein QXZ25_05320 [Candidatus Bathyarchaeia archaeon]
MFFGLLLTLVPFFTIAEIKSESDYMAAFSAPPRTEKIEGKVHGHDWSLYLDDGLGVLAISLTIALFAYLLAKRRIP